jgi:hypothetical protein
MLGLKDTRMTKKEERERERERERLHDPALL